MRPASKERIEAAESRENWCISRRDSGSDDVSDEGEAKESSARVCRALRRSETKGGT